MVRQVVQNHNATRDAIVSTRTNLTSVAAAGTVAGTRLLGGTVQASGQLDSKTDDTTRAADDVAALFDARNHTFHRSLDDLTTDPAGACYGQAPTITAVDGFATIGTAGSDVIFGVDGDDII